MNHPREISGVGIGLRHKHFKQIIDEKPDIPWLEVHTENFFSSGSSASQYLELIRQNYPISAHCIGLSLGSHKKPEQHHLEQIKQFLDRIQPQLFSDHLSWSSNKTAQLPDLLPIPYTQEALAITCRNIDIVQNFTNRQLLIENPSSYLGFKNSPIPENEFLIEAAKKTGAAILLDVNNIYVSAHNHGFDPLQYIGSIPVRLVKEIHLAGFNICEIEGKEVLIDTHGNQVFDPVWDLFAYTVKRFASTPTLIEWDTDIPELSVLIAEKHKAEQIIKEVNNG